MTIFKATVSGGKGDVRVLKHRGIIPHKHRFFDHSIQTYRTCWMWFESWYLFQMHNGTTYKEWRTVENWTCKNQEELNENLEAMRNDLEYQEVTGTKYVAYFSKLPRPRIKPKVARV